MEPCNHCKKKDECPLAQHLTKYEHGSMNGLMKAVFNSPIYAEVVQAGDKKDIVLECQEYVTSNKGEIDYSQLVGRQKEELEKYCSTSSDCGNCKCKK